LPPPSRSVGTKYTIAARKAKMLAAYQKNKLAIQASYQPPNTSTGINSPSPMNPNKRRRKEPIYQAVVAPPNPYFGSSNMSSWVPAVPMRAPSP
jgi:hypothetical protein